MRMDSVDAKKSNYPKFRYGNEFGIDSGPASARAQAGPYHQQRIQNVVVETQHESTTEDVSPLEAKNEGNPMDCSVVTNDVSHLYNAAATNPFAIGGYPARTHQVEYFNETSKASTKDELKLLKQKV